MTERIAEFAIVVIGRNEGARLRDCLVSALRASSRVVYADSASTDGSTHLARSMGVITVEVDSSAPLNAARGRNAGMTAARSAFPECPYVQFIDGDCVLQDGWTEAASRFLESNPRAAVVCGRRFEAHPEASFYNRLADEEWNTPVGLAEACGGDSMMRIAALEEVGGFNPSLMASEEPELTARMRNRGWEVWRLDAPMTEHDAAVFSFGQWWRRTTRAGYGCTQAFLSTARLSQRVNSKLLASAVLWSVCVPAAVLMAAVAFRRSEIVLLLPLAYAMQVMRMALRRRPLSWFGIRASAMFMIAKFGEVIGAARFLLGPRRPTLIEYKTTPIGRTAGLAKERLSNGL